MRNILHSTPAEQALRKYERAMPRLRHRLGAMTVEAADPVAARRHEITQATVDALERLAAAGFNEVPVVTSTWKDPSWHAGATQLVGSVGWRVYGQGDSPMTDTPAGDSITLHLLPDGTFARERQQEGRWADEDVAVFAVVSAGQLADERDHVYQHALEVLQNLGR